MNRTRGFTLVEVLVVVIILGILAVMVVPQLSSAGDCARESMLADDVRTMRMQIMLFQWEHRGVAPGYPALDPTSVPTEDAFVAHLTQATTVDGDAAAPGTPGYPFGSYMRQIPENPVNQLLSVQVIANGAAFPTEADDSDAWIYKPQTLELRADATGTDQAGRSIFDY